MMDGGGWKIYMYAYTEDGVTYVNLCVNLDNDAIYAGYLRESNYLGSGYEDMEITISIPE